MLVSQYFLQKNKNSGIYLLCELTGHISPRSISPNLTNTGVGATSQWYCLQKCGFQDSSDVLDDLIMENVYSDEELKKENKGRPNNLLKYPILQDIVSERVDF